MGETEEDTKEETETEVHKTIETKKVDGQITVHKEEETKKKTKIETNADKMPEDKKKEEEK